MTSIKSFIKRIPLFEGIVNKAKRVLKSPTPPIQGLNNNVFNEGVFEKVIIDIIGNNNTIEIGKNTVIKNTLIYLRGNNHKLVIKDNCYFKGGELWIEDNDGTILIHENTTVEHAHIAVTEPFSILEIQRDCMLAQNIEIRTGDSHSIIDNETGKRINKAANVFLGEHVWIGTHVKILKGVTIGNNSIVGTGSIVTTNVPSFSIAAGIPAKVVRSGIDWTRDRKYQ